MKRQQTEEKFNILYARLSRDDDQIGESGSIQNQKMILEKFAKDNGFHNTLTLVDDGYSGTSFQRPSFMKILELMEQDKVLSITCKDHSRLGRNYLVIGSLMEEFQRKNIRYIAIHDNIDTSKGIDDFLPLHDVFNEFHAKNTSKKIRAVVQAKGKSGKRLGVIPPYGYRKDGNGEFAIDEVSAKVVQRIFAMYVSGVNAGTIANTLSSEHLLIPSAYKYEHGIVSKPRACKDPCFWNPTTIHKLLDTQEYIGDTVNFKTYSNSYKDSKSRENDKDKRLIFKNTHPAIISAETWEIVQKMRGHKRRYNSYGTQGLFSGTLFCSDCGEKLYFNISKTKSKLVNQYSCSTYRKAQGNCTAHYIREDTLAELVLTDLRKLLGFVRRYEKQFVRLVMDSSLTEQNREMQGKRKSLDKLNKRIKEIDTVIENLYVDKISGKISEERFDKMASRFETEQTELSAQADTLQADLSDLEQESVNVDRFLAVVRKYTEVKELTPAIIHEFIDKIIIHQPDSPRKNRVQKVEIIYNNIGVFDLSALEQEQAV